MYYDCTLKIIDRDVSYTKTLKVDQLNFYLHYLSEFYSASVIMKTGLLLHSNEVRVEPRF